MDNCLLCKNAEATQTNSHIVPSFLGARIFSYDGSGKRGKDIAFTLTATRQKVHTGDLPSTKYEELFGEGSLNEDRINELKVDSLAKDYYLCPQCEKLLAEYLESPYASFLKSGKHIPGDISLFFWMSVVWRISITKVLGDWLSPDVEECMRNYLFSYLEHKKLGIDTKTIVEKMSFRYKILYCPEYLSNDAGFVNFKTNETHDSAAFICGDTAVFIGIDSNVNDFWGLEGYLDEATSNTGIQAENRCIVPMEPFVDAKKAIIQSFVKGKIEYERNVLNQIWAKHISGEMPIELQNEIIESIHGEGLKLGDRGEMKLWPPIIFEKMSNYIKEHSQNP